MLDTSSWEFFLLHRICSIDMGNKMDFSAMSTESPSVNFVGRSAENNGVMGKVDLVDGIAPYPAGSLTVALGGSLGSTFLQTDPFYTSQNVSVLSFDENEVSPLARLFLASMVHFESKFKYFPFGRELNKYLRTVYGFNLPIKRDELGKPVVDPSKRFHDEGYVPDWRFMGDFIRSLDHERVTTKNKKTVLNLDVDRWAYFAIGDFFDIKPTRAYKDLVLDDLDDGGSTPVIVNSSTSNGVGGFSTLAPTESGGKITFSDTTDGNTFFYQPDPFIGFAHVQGMYEKDVHNWTQEQLLFLVAILTFDSAGRYNYGRKMTRKSILARKVLLPVAANGEPDWEFMENYIRSLPYGDRIPETATGPAGAVGD